MSTHERIGREERVVGSSDRAFGFVFGGFFALLTLLNLWRGWSGWGWAFAGLALAFAAAALFAPGVLAPFNRLWLKLGLVLHKAVTPIVMAMLFYLVITPMGVAMRLMGKDFLRLKRDPEAKSYWIERRPPGPAPDTMKNQF
ncbi:MAG: SxtJ family membrane protein [Rhodospirillales bacterium]